MTLDIGNSFKQPGGKEGLAKKFEHAVIQRSGGGDSVAWQFRSSQDEVDVHFALGREFCTIPLKEELKYHNDEA